MQIPEASEEGCEDWCLPCLGKARAGIDASPDPCEGRALACILAVGARGSGDVRICEYACLRGLLAEVRDPCQQVLLASAWRGVLVHPPGVRMLAGAGIQALVGLGVGSVGGTAGPPAHVACANPWCTRRVCACTCPTDGLAISLASMSSGSTASLLGLGVVGQRLCCGTNADRRAELRVRMLACWREHECSQWFALARVRRTCWPLKFG